MGNNKMFRLALATVSAVQLAGKPVQKKTKDIACHEGEGANGVGHAVCDIVKEVVDVKPWPRSTPEPKADIYWKGNSGDQWANADGTLKAAPEPAAAESPAKEAKKEEKEAAKEEKKEEAPKEEAKKEEAPKEEKKEEAAPAKE